MEGKIEAEGQGESSVEAVKMQIYQLQGPKWRNRLHSGSKAIGIPDLYLHRANVAEDDISETAVKNGFSIPQMVGNETFSAHDMIFDRLKAKGLLSQINSLFHEVNLRRGDICTHRNSAAPLQSRPPQRVTLNEVKLAAYIKELADPSIPLKKLARSVPHGYRGERMLDMLWNGGNLTQAMAAIKAQSSSMTLTSTASRSVTIERAIWFVRVVGASELTSSRIRQSNGNTYTTEWTTVIMGWLRRQIVELNVIQSSVATPTTPSSPAASNHRTSGPATTKYPLLSHDGHYSLLLEDDFRNRWVAKWHYSVTLLRGLCHEHLIDPQAVAKSALDMLRTANLAQLSFAMALSEEFLDVVYSSAGLVDHSLDTLCAKLADLTSTLEDGRFGEDIVKELESIIIGIMKKTPNALVNPNRWHKHRDVLTRLMQLALSTELSTSISHRNERLLDAMLEQRHFVSLVPEQRTDVDILDRIAVDLSVEAAFLELFRSSRQSSSSEKLRSVLLWSTTAWRCGSHRPFAGALLLNLFSQAKDSKLKRHGKAVVSIQKIDLGTFLLKWISEVETAMQQNEQVLGSSKSTVTAIQSVDVASLIILIGEAIRLGFFSYPKYLQRLTARGLTAVQARDDKSSTSEFLHAKVMRSVPLPSASSSLENQRRVAIYGNRTKESWEEAMHRRASKEAANAFAYSASFNSIEWNEDETMRHFWTSSRFVQHRVIQGHFMTYFRQSSSFHALTSRCFIHLSQFLAKAEDFVSLCEILAILFDRRQQMDPSLISICVDTALEHRLVWISMGLPLLQQLGVSPFPSHKNQRGISQEHHMQQEVKNRLQKSARNYLHGNHSQASILLSEVASQTDSTIGMLASNALFASALILQEVGEESNSVHGLISWMKLIPAATGTIWDSTWQMAVVDCLLSGDIRGQGIDKALTTLLVHLMQFDLILAEDLLRRYIVPCLEQWATTFTSSDNVVPPIQPAVDLIRALLLNDVDDADTILLARLRCIRSSLVASNTIKEIISVVASLALLEGQEPVGKLPFIRQSLCREPLIQLHFQADLSDLCIYLEDRLRGDSLSNIVADLLSVQSTLLLDNALEIDYQRNIEDSSDWLCQQRLFELSVLVHRLDTVESGQQNRGQSKIQSIARLSVNRWFRSSTMQRYGLFLVTQSRSASFQVAVNEELLKRIKIALDQGTKEDVLEAVLCAMHLIRASTKSSLPSVSVSASLLSSIGESLAATKESWEDEVEADKEEKLGLRLAVICLLLRFDNIWTTPTKATILQLIFALLTQAVTLSCQGQARDAVVHQNLDVIAYCMQELPSDVRQAVQNMADAVVNMVQQSMPEDSVASRILFLFNRLPISTAATSMVLAASGDAGFVSGRLLPVTERPWELHNNVEALDYYMQHQQTKDGEDDHTFTPLVNNGPISLELFSAKKTRDRLPLVDVQVDSEVSYGLGWGGEPLFARDLRRGLLNLEREELVNRRKKEQPEQGVESSAHEKVEQITSKPSTMTSKKRSEPASAPSTTTAAAAATAPKKKARKR